MKRRWDTLAAYYARGGSLMNRRVLGICAWYGYLGLMASTLMQVGVHLSWGRGMLLNVSLAAATTSAVMYAAFSPPAWVDRRRSAHPLDALGAGCVYMSAFASGLIGVMLERDEPLHPIRVVVLASLALPAVFLVARQRASASSAASRGAS